MKNLIFLFILGACSSLTQYPDSKTDEPFPSWIYSPYDFCSESSELCASGEGPDSKTSENEARSNLASIFKVHVGSSLQSSITEENSVHQLEMKIRSEATQTIQVDVDEILESVQIKNDYVKDGVYYSLAILDRVAATNILTKRIQQIDKELNVYWSKKKRTLSRKMLRLSAQRSIIEEKLAILTPTFEPASVSFHQILEWSLSSTNPKFLNLKVAHAPKWLTAKLSSLLSEVGFKVQNVESTDFVTINVTAIREFLSIEGFEKYTFTMNIINIQNGVKVGQLTKVETVIGRNQEDALLKIKKSFNHYLEEELYNLNLD